MDRPSWVPEDLYPFESRYVDVPGARVHLVDEGDGPPLLLLHGNPTWSFLYRGIIKGLRDRFRCLAVDFPGFGLSKPPPGYGFTPAEHARVLEQLVLALELSGIGLREGNPETMGADGAGFVAVVSLQIDVAYARHHLIHPKFCAIEAHCRRPQTQRFS